MWNVSIFFVTFIATSKLDTEKLEVTKGNPFLVNIESSKNFGPKKKAKKENENLEKESHEGLNSQSSDSVIKADQVAIMQPILMQLKKSLLEDEKQN